MRWLELKIGLCRVTIARKHDRAYRMGTIGPAFHLYSSIYQLVNEISTINHASRSGQKLYRFKVVTLVKSQTD